MSSTVPADEAVVSSSPSRHQEFSATFLSPPDQSRPETQQDLPDGAVDRTTVSQHPGVASAAVALSPFYPWPNEMGQTSSSSPGSSANPSAGSSRTINPTQAQDPNGVEPKATASHDVSNAPTSGWSSGFTLFGLPGFPTAASFESDMAASLESLRRIRDDLMRTRKDPPGSAESTTATDATTVSLPKAPKLEEEATADKHEDDGRLTPVGVGVPGQTTGDDARIVPPASNVQPADNAASLESLTRIKDDLTRMGDGMMREGSPGYAESGAATVATAVGLSDTLALEEEAMTGKHEEYQAPASDAQREGDHQASSSEAQPAGDYQVPASVAQPAGDALEGGIPSANVTESTPAGSKRKSENVDADELAKRQRTLGDAATDNVKMEPRSESPLIEVKSEPGLQALSREPCPATATIASETLPKKPSRFDQLPSVSEPPSTSAPLSSTSTAPSEQLPARPEEARPASETSKSAEQTSSPEDAAAKAGAASAKNAEVAERLRQLQAKYSKRPDKPTIKRTGPGYGVSKATQPQNSTLPQPPASVTASAHTKKASEKLAASDPINRFPQGAYDGKRPAGYRELAPDNAEPPQSLPAHTWASATPVPPQAYDRAGAYDRAPAPRTPWLEEKPPGVQERGGVWDQQVGASKPSDWALSSSPTTHSHIALAGWNSDSRRDSAMRPPPAPSFPPLPSERVVESARSYVGRSATPLPRTDDMSAEEKLRLWERCQRERLRADVQSSVTSAVNAELKFDPTRPPPDVRPVPPAPPAPAPPPYFRREEEESRQYYWRSESRAGLDRSYSPPRASGYTPQSSYPPANPARPPPPAEPSYSPPRASGYTQQSSYSPANPARPPPPPEPSYAERREPVGGPPYGRGRPVGGAQEEEEEYNPFQPLRIDKLAAVRPPPTASGGAPYPPPSSTPSYPPPAELGRSTAFDRSESAGLAKDHREFTRRPPPPPPPPPPRPPPAFTPSTAVDPGSLASYRGGYDGPPPGYTPRERYGGTPRGPSPPPVRRESYGYDDRRISGPAPSDHGSYDRSDGRGPSDVGPPPPPRPGSSVYERQYRPAEAPRYANYPPPPPPPSSSAASAGRALSSDYGSAPRPRPPAVEYGSRDDHASSRMYSSYERPPPPSPASYDEQTRRNHGPPPPPPPLPPPPPPRIDAYDVYRQGGAPGRGSLEGRYGEERRAVVGGYGSGRDGMGSQRNGEPPAPVRPSYDSSRWPAPAPAGTDGRDGYGRSAPMPVPVPPRPSGGYGEYAPGPASAAEAGTYGRGPRPPSPPPHHPHFEDVYAGRPPPPPPPPPEYAGRRAAGGGYYGPRGDGYG